jgi:hypothetical protein
MKRLTDRNRGISAANRAFISFSRAVALQFAAPEMFVPALTAWLAAQPEPLRRRSPAGRQTNIRF